MNKRSLSLKRKGIHGKKQLEQNKTLLNYLKGEIKEYTSRMGTYLDMAKITHLDGQTEFNKRIENGKIARHILFYLMKQKLKIEEKLKQG